MTRISRRSGVTLLCATAVAVLGLVGCSGSGGNGQGDGALGQMNLPLTTQAASGVSYRLRDATFVVQQQQYYYYYEDVAGAGGTSGGPYTRTVSSETDPSSSTISLSLEEGYYNVQLRPGWSMEKLTADGPQTVEATLLSGTSQWVYVSRQSTSWAEYRFGLGGREIWLNGKLNIGIDVQEAPGGGGGGEGGEVGVFAEGGSIGG